LRNFRLFRLWTWFPGRKALRMGCWAKDLTRGIALTFFIAGILMLNIVLGSISYQSL
jgi:hypothetical protein